MQMPMLQMQITDAQQNAIKAEAEKLGLTAAAWARMTLIQALPAAPQAQRAGAAPSKPYVKPGPKPMPKEAFVNLRMSEDNPFPSGQRRAKWINGTSNPSHAEQEGAHAAVERDLASAYARGVKRMDHDEFVEYNAYCASHEPDAAYVENMRRIFAGSDKPTKTTYIPE